MKNRILFSLALFLAACSSSHGTTDAGPRLDGGAVTCGAVTCDDGLVCCNASCGICAAPGEGCPAIACVDAGPRSCIDGMSCGPSEQCCPGCSGTSGFCAPASEMCPPALCPPPCPGCDAGERCCPGCGDEPICVPEGSMCPEVDCPPPPCDACDDSEQCCDGCPGDPPFCSPAGASCPLLDCPAPSCDACDDSQRCCEGCEGDAPICVPADSPCPDVVCPVTTCSASSDCADTEYCAKESCGAVGECRPRPEVCTADCPGVCGCDGETYCNACGANAAGVSVSRAGACDTTTCAGREYCDCTGECEPLVDLTPGCVCPCDDPFNCTGELCACACGGAEYRGCAPVGACPETQRSCGLGCEAVLGGDGCLVCVCEDAP